VPDFVGGDPESNASECPAAFVDPETGDFLFRGKTVTDPALITALNEHIGKAEDESDVWLPARMARSSARLWTDTSRTGRALASTASLNCWRARTGQ